MTKWGNRFLPSLVIGAWSLVIATVMDAKARAAFRRRLLAWYARHARDLPWRRSRDPYRVWVSEVTLQQTTVRVVLPYYERFLERFPSVTALASASEAAGLAAGS